METVINWGMNVARKLLTASDPEYVDLFDWEQIVSPILRDGHMEVYYGVTKICVVPQYFDWCVKFDILRDNSVRRREYCAQEAEYFEDAEDEGLEKYFARTYKIGFCCERVICAQEKVFCDEDRVTEEFFDFVVGATSDEKDNYEDEDAYCDFAWNLVDDMDTLERLQAMFNGEDVDKLYDFIEDHNINDLHAGNWGRTSDGNWVMVDFSGY